MRYYFQFFVSLLLTFLFCSFAISQQPPQNSTAPAKPDPSPELYVKTVITLDELGYEPLATQIALKFPSTASYQNFLEQTSEVTKRFRQIMIRDISRYRRSPDKKIATLDNQRLTYLIWMLSNLQNRMKEATLAEILHRAIRQTWDEDVAQEFKKNQPKLYAWYLKYSQSQGIVFAQTFSAKGDDLVRRVIQCADNGYAIIGETDSKNNGRRDILWVKHDMYGKCLWDQNVAGQAKDSGNALVQTKDGGYALIGTTWSSGAGRNDVWLLKTDAKGKLEWNKTFGEARTDEGIDIALLPDDSFLILAKRQRSESIEPEPTLIKVDNKGQMIWQKYFECIDENEPQRLKVFDDGSALVLVNVKKDRWGIWLIKVNAQGEKTWEQFLGGNRDDKASDMAILSDGILILAETSSFGKGRQNVWLIKTDLEGQKILEKVIGSGEDYNYPTSLAIATDHNWVITGYTTGFGSNQHSAWIVKFDVNGKILWNKSLKEGKPRFIMLCQDQGFIIVGEVASEENGADIFLIKTDANGKFE